VNLVKSLFTSLADLFHWRMLVLILVPPLIALTLWGILAWVFWDPMLTLTADLGNRWNLSNLIPEWFMQWFSLDAVQVVTAVAAGIALCLVILPLTFLTSQLIASVILMPFVIKHVHKNYPNLTKKDGQGLFRATIVNQIRSSIIYLFLWVLLFPLWVIPGMNFALPMILNGYLNFRLFAFDALSEHSTKDEIVKFMKLKRLDFLILGILTSALLLFPPLFLVVPLYTALCFTRFAMSELIQFRALDKG
jgi:CysZ protein